MELRNGRKVIMTKEINLYDNRVIFQLPEEFVAVQDINKYFLTAKPDFAFVEQETNALVSVLKTEYKTTGVTIDDRIMEYCDLYKRSVPNFGNFKIAKKKTKSGAEIAAFYYTSTSPERDLYNFFILTSIDECELIFTLHCGIENASLYGIKFMNLLNSIDVVE